MTTLATVIRYQRARRSQAMGHAAEGIVRQRLLAIGLKMVRRVHTGCVYSRKLGTWRPGEQVEGDWRAVGPMGVSVLVESKLRDRDVRWSDLEPHQIAALDVHTEAGGYSILAVVHLAHGVALLSWSTLKACGFGPGKSVTPPMAMMCQARP